MIFRKNFPSRLVLLPFSFLVLWGPGVGAEPANDLEEEISVKFSTKREGDDPGSVMGSVKNTSANAYPCVRIEFDLKTRFDLRRAGEKGRHLGVLVVDVQDLAPQGEIDFQQQLPYPAGAGLKSVSACSPKPNQEPPGKEPPGKEPPGQEPPGQEPPGKKPPAPRPPAPIPPAPRPPNKEETSPPKPSATCSITGRISGKLQWDTKDDRGQHVSFALEHMFLRAPGTERPEHTRVQGREYTFKDLPAGKTYKISAGSFRSEPQEKSVSCRPGSRHRGVDFKIIGAPPSG